MASGEKLYPIPLPSHRPPTSPTVSWHFLYQGPFSHMVAGEAFTLLTTEPGPDVAPIHDRQMVVLECADWLASYDLTWPEAELLGPFAGRLVGC